MNLIVIKVVSNAMAQHIKIVYLVNKNQIEFI